MKEDLYAKFRDAREVTILKIEVNEGEGVDGDPDEDELYEDARAVVMEAGKASTSFFQRKLKVGYSRAARLIDLLEERGIVGPADGAKPREVIQGYQAADVAERIQQEMLNAAQED